MKNFLSFTALFAVLLPTATGCLQALGFAVPTVLSVEIALALFVAAFSFLAFQAAYSRPRVIRARRDRVPALRLLPAVEAFGSGGRPATADGAAEGSSESSAPTVACKEHAKS